MSKYPSWWNQSVTVYNKFENPETREITWYKTILHNCFWKYTENRLSVNDTVIETNATICRVPVKHAFKERYEWEQLSEQEKSTYFTFGTGDIIVRGEVDDTIDEYATNHRSSDLLKKYKRLQGCMVVERCSVNTGTGRGCEHYYVRGV